MTSQANRKVRLKSRPAGIPQADNFGLLLRPYRTLPRSNFWSVTSIFPLSLRCVDGCLLSRTIPPRSGSET